MWFLRRKHKPPPEPPAPEPAAPEPAPEPRQAEPHAQRTADDVLRELAGQPQPATRPKPEAHARPDASRGPIDPSLGRCLMAEGPVTREFLRQQIAVSGKSEAYLCQVLAGVHAPAEAALFRILAAGYQMPLVDLKQCKVVIPVARSVPREIALKYKMVPIDRIGDLLCVVFAGEPNPKAVEAIRRATGLRVKALQCPAHHLNLLLRRLYLEAPDQEAVAAVPISEREYEEAATDPEARWESVHATRGPVRAERLGPH